MVTYSGTLAGSDGSTLAVTGTLSPAPVTPVTPVTPGGVTTRRRMLWHQGWQGPSITAWPVDVAPSLTTVCLDMCQSAGAGTGKLADPPGVTKSQILALAGDGVEVLAGIGGSGDGGITITTAAQVADAYASIVSMQSRLAIAGVVLDLEGDPGSGWTPATMIQLGQLVVGAGMRFGICSALYSGRLAAWGSVAKALGASLDHWQRMFYDFPQATSSQLSGVVTGQQGFAAMRPYLVRDEQLVASFMPQTPSDTNTSPVGVITAAYSAARTAGWADAGWAVFEDAIEQANGWTATRALGQL